MITSATGMPFVLLPHASAIIRIRIISLVIDCLLFSMELNVIPMDKIISDEKTTSFHICAVIRIT
ncbi:hypothetical protein VEE61_34370 [Escherichia coli]|nr:hypothetical protein VEE61_34370 [Escherichia coli]